MPIITAEADAGFPKADVDSSDNVELMLLNADIISSSHQSAEAASRLYKTGHLVLNLIAARQLNDEDRQLAFSFGITLFEALSVMVRPKLDDAIHNGEAADKNILAAIGEIDGYLIESAMVAKEQLLDDLPQTSRLIAQAAYRFNRFHSDYSIGGAALARSLELRAFETDTTI